MSRRPPRAELHRRWKYLEDGAALASHLASAAREGDLADLAEAVTALDDREVRCALVAFALMASVDAAVLERAR